MQAKNFKADQSSLSSSLELPTAMSSVQTLSAAFGLDQFLKGKQLKDIFFILLLENFHLKLTVVGWLVCFFFNSVPFRSSSGSGVVHLL